MKFHLDDAQTFLGVDGPHRAPAHADATMPGSTSTTIYCVMNLTIQYFLIYIALALVRIYIQLSKTERKIPALQLIEVATQTVNCAPMLCVLFVAARMRALQLSQGESEPQDWVQLLMQVCTYSVMLQTLLVLFLPWLLGEPPRSDDHGNLDTPQVRRMNVISAFVTLTLKYLAMLGLYGGFAGVCVGVVAMQGPRKYWQNGTPPLSPAVSATINLTIQYFVVYLLLGLVRTHNQLKGWATSKAQQTLQLAQYTVQFAPMLCILFISARMRALQIDPLHGHPQPWAQGCFHICAYTLLVQTLIVVLAPFLSPKKGEVEGTIDFDVDSGPLVTAGTIIRYVAMLTLYIGFSVVIISILTIEHPEDKVMKMSRTMECCLILTVQFFAVYLILSIAVTYRELTGNRIPTIITTLENARGTVTFCPMLCILFVGTHIRVGEISHDEHGYPQPWAQDSMYLCVGALLVQLIMCLITPLFTGRTSEVDADGNVKLKVWWNSETYAYDMYPEEGEPKGIWTNIFVNFLVFVRYAALMSLYGGVLLVCSSIYLLTPRSVDTHGQANLVFSFSVE